MTQRRFSIKTIIILLVGLIMCGTLSAQERTITAGFQFKPLFSSKFFNTGPENVVVNNISFTIEPKGGYCFGMVIRRGFTNTLSFETGINYVSRNFQLKISDTLVREDTRYKIVGYEIPIQGLVFIQLSDQIYMDVAMGLSIDFFPSDVQTRGEHYNHISARKSWVSSSVIANLGWEYRTESSGYFYLGASFHRPFSFIYRAVFDDLSTADDPETPLNLQGNYLTVDLRYFFHSDPLRRKKVKKNDPRTK